MKHEKKRNKEKTKAGLTIKKERPKQFRTLFQTE
jgi:hypothetical protein